MLAAVTSEDERTLDTFKLALILVSQDKPCSDELWKYFKSVVKESLSLIESPETEAFSARPESVSLALRLIADEHLKDNFAKSLSNDKIIGDWASEVLDNLEVNFDTDCQSSHLSREILAAI